MTTAHFRRTFKRKSNPPSEVLAKKVLMSRKRKSATPAKNQKSIMKLSKAVSALKVSEFGQKQIQRQLCRKAGPLFAGPPNTVARISAGFPICWCHQAIDAGTQVYQPQLDAISGILSSQPIASWNVQPYPLINFDATSVRFDQLKYLQNNSIGVQPGYYHHSSSYNLKFTATNWRGWVEILVVSTRKQYTRQAAPDVDEFQLPPGLPGFSNSCGGTPNQYSWNPLFYGVKRMKRLYFNTEEENSLRTNPDSYSGLVVRNSKARAHIRAQTTAEYQLPQPTTPITYIDIPLEQQDWIVITTSNPALGNDASNLSIAMTRCNVWRDSVGSS